MLQEVKGEVDAGVGYSMSLFDRIFRRKVSPAISDGAHPSWNPARPIVSDPASAPKGIEDQGAKEGPLTTTTAPLPQSSVVDHLAPLPEHPQIDGGVDTSKNESFERHAPPEVVVASDDLPPTDVTTSSSSEPSVRELAVLRIVIALREVLTQRLFQDLASSKLEIARLYGEALDQIRTESPVVEPGPRANSDGLVSPVDGLKSNASPGDATPVHLLLEASEGNATLVEQLGSRIDELEAENAEIRNSENERLARIRSDLDQQQQQIAKEREGIDKRVQEVDAQSRRLAEREATVYKNFSELQRREQLLAGFKRPQIEAGPHEGAVFNEEVRVLRAQIKADTSAAKEREAYLVEKLRVLKERHSADANEAFKMRKAIQEQLDQADNSIQNLLKAKQQLESSLESERQKRAAPQKGIKGKSRTDSTLISVSDQRIIDWMLEGASPEQAGVDHGYLSLIGEGPWSDHQIRELMEGAGFSLWMLPDTDVEHVVVGRHSWDADALEQQIEAMEGTRLRIYSQEMWFAKLVTGRDPFDSGDHDLLMAFAIGHPALEHLIERDAPWPEVSSDDLVVGDGVSTEGFEFGVNSPLHNFGYQVGLSSWLSVSQRRGLLTKFLEAKELTFDGKATAEYRSHWGRPRSVQRLFRIASHIRWLILWQGKSPSRMQANEDWRGDLQWLKKTYYKPKLHKFHWPGV